MNELSLFTGAGGGLLGTHLLGWRPVGYVEWNEYCQRVIAARIRDGILPAAPIFGDIYAFNREGYAAAYTGMVDVITGGFPCQPFSLAGKRQGAADERNGWPATIECLRVVRPEWALLENVPGLLTSGYFGTILGDLAESGFDCRWRVLSAAEVGAPHRRDRLWIVAHAQRAERGACESGRYVTDWDHAEWSEATSGIGTSGANGRAQDVAEPDSRGRGPDGERSGLDGIRRGGENDPMASPQRGTDVANAHQGRRPWWAGEQRPGWGRQSEDGSSEGIPNPERQSLALGDRQQGSRGARPDAAGGDWWAAEPDVGRVAHGVAARVDRLTALGNGQVPAVVRAAWLLMGECLQ